MGSAPLSTARPPEAWRSVALCQPSGDALTTVATLKPVVPEAKVLRRSHTGTHPDSCPGTARACAAAERAAGREEAGRHDGWARQPFVWFRSMQTMGLDEGMR